MSKFLNTSNQTIAWFKRAFDNGELEMKPPFQRNPVWTDKQKSYLMDTILNGFPVPEIYLQTLVTENGDEKHVVIDGQQRLRACLGFLEGAFRIDVEESPSWAGLYFDDLSVEDKKSFFSYKFVVRLLPEMPDEEIRGIFKRLNRNVVALNPQELRQATYWGSFIKTVQQIADFPYWSTCGIFSPVNIRRMMDVEYISELSVAYLNGHQNKKETLDDFYQMYESEFDQSEELLDAFRLIIGEIEQVLPDIKGTRWRKKSDFYSLFMLLAENKDQLPLSSEKRANLRLNLLRFGEQIDAYLKMGSEKSDVSSEISVYAESVRASSDLSNRKRRHEKLLLCTADSFSNNENSVRIIPDFQPNQNLFEDIDLDEINGSNEST